MKGSYIMLIQRLMQKQILQHLVGHVICIFSMEDTFLNVCITHDIKDTEVISPEMQTSHICFYFSYTD